MLVEREVDLIVFVLTGNFDGEGDEGLLVERDVDLRVGFIEGLPLGKVVGFFNGNLDGVVVECEDTADSFFTVGVTDVTRVGLLDGFNLEEGAEEIEVIILVNFEAVSICKYEELDSDA